MRNGVVLVDADASVRAVARTMRDHGVPAVFVVDLSAEAIGVVEERDLLKGWDDPDRTTAAQVMNLDPVIVDPDEPVGNATRRMLELGVTRMLVALPPPSEESGRWLDWRERGLPLGTLSVDDVLARLEELEPAVRRRAVRSGQATGRRVAPAVAVASILVAIALIVLAAVLFFHGHPVNLSPGCSHPTQGGC